MTNIKTFVCFLAIIPSMFSKTIRSWLVRQTREDHAAKIAKLRELNRS